MTRGPFTLADAHARHRAKGAQSRRDGDCFESWCAGQHLLAIRAGLLAWSRHVSPRVRWVGSGARAHAVVVGEAVADYVGQLVDGRALVVEAKATREDRLARSVIEPQQSQHLDAAALNGGVALLLVELRIGDATRRFAVPWPVPWRERGRGGSVGIEELAPWEVAPGAIYLAKIGARG